ncbi:LuxE/PaaK family acyltransferase [Nonlabens marinus]|uniref:Long-chain-fatty-acid--luciferin-component ligase n=1 Tax=Nonlabens marinus S1-08 TaxID=1454201 RepID=W8VQM6_9FLAO|nr:acyltransferase [Nonlabens marinus]BAO55160.1 long-chain-fatty-acid--luciferin-component ligase [Nonlabens marinus S1-08]
MKFPVFDIKSDRQFNELALEVYTYQFERNQVYRKYCQLLGKPKAAHVSEIPFLPISFFKTHQVTTDIQKDPAITFTSSGTTGIQTSQHLVGDLEIYNQSLDHSFKQFYGNHEDYTILALLPHYLERTGSSLVYMVDRWIKKSGDAQSGFYLNNLDDLAQILKSLQDSNRKVILIGVTFALLQLAEKFPMELNNTIIIETGGMKGMRKEMIKPELHQILKSAFNPQGGEGVYIERSRNTKAETHSEYGMTELLSQAYAPDGIRFQPPAWMQVSTRDTNDPLSRIAHGKTGGLNVIDLANLESCSFIATQDLCKTYADGTFEVLGRFDHSDIRGCNLLAVG